MHTEVAALARCSVVLVRPHYPGNLGAVARLMANFGFRDLILVDSRVDPADRDARRQSTHGEWILDASRAVPDLPAALEGCLCAAATSARAGILLRGHAQEPAAAAQALLPHLDHGRIALVFGPEPSGLTNDEITLCQHLIEIPAEASYPALNLAQAAAICLYEMRQAVLAKSSVLVEDEPPADFDLQQRMFGSLQSALEDIHYLYGPKGPVLMHGLRQLIGRARPTETEAKLLLGLARQIRWFAQQGRSCDAAESTDPGAEAKLTP